MIFGQTYSRNFEIITQVGCNKNIDGGALISDCAILESVYIQIFRNLDRYRIENSTDILSY